MDDDPPNPSDGYTGHQRVAAAFGRERCAQKCLQTAVRFHRVGGAVAEFQITDRLATSAAAQTEDSHECADMRFWVHGPDRLSSFVGR